MMGLEDYCFLNYLVYTKFAATEPQIKKDCIDGLRCGIIDSIYNFGKVQLIYKLFPKGLASFLGEYDTIFTINYDNNLEKITSKKIYHLHGDFTVKQEIYNPNSFRNKFPIVL